MSNKTEKVPVVQWRPYGKHGQGLYSKKRSCATDLMDKIAQKILDAVDAVEKPESGPFVICDYGCADGGISLPVIKKCIDMTAEPIQAEEEKIKKKFGADQEVMVVYEDQPTSDFKSVFAYTQGMIPGMNSNYAHIPGVSILACGTTFYQQCLPANFVHLSLTTFAVHWLKSRPCKLSGLAPYFLPENDEGKKIFAAKGAEDWEEYLLLRSKELVPGARMVVAPGGRMSTGSGSILHLDYETYYQTIDNSVKAMVQEGLIDKEEHEEMTFGFYDRTLEECESPFKDENSAVRKSGLHLLSSCRIYVDCPYRMTAEKLDPESEEAKQNIRDFTQMIKQCAFGSVFSGLRSARPEEERRKLAEEVFTRFHQATVKNSPRFGMDHVVICLEIEKEINNNSSY